MDLGGILDTARPVLPILSYFVNLITKMFDIVLSYLGIELPETEEETSEDTVTPEVGA